MIILAIDSSGQRSSVCLISARKLFFSGFSEVNASSDYLSILIKRVLDESGYRVSDLDFITVNIGPGSFTGLRSGIAAANGLAAPYDVQIYGASVMELICFCLTEAFSFFVNYYNVENSDDKPDVDNFISGKCSIAFPFRSNKLCVQSFSHNCTPISEICILEDKTKVLNLSRPVDARELALFSLYKKASGLPFMQPSPVYLTGPKVLYE